MYMCMNMMNENAYGSYECDSMKYDKIICYS